MSILENKKVIIIGDRDGVPGEAIAECVKTVDSAEVVFSSTECFVWTAAGAMDLENQKRVKDLTEEHGGENIVVVFGAGEAETAGLAAETVSNGDPTFAGPLAGVSLGLKTFHAIEDEFKTAVDEDVFEEQVGMMEMVLDLDSIKEEMDMIRSNYCQF